MSTQWKIDLQTVTWMDNTTRKRAIDKLAHIRNQIGYPANPSNYSETPVVADQANADECTEFFREAEFSLTT